MRDWLPEAPLTLLQAFLLSLLFATPLMTVMFWLQWRVGRRMRDRKKGKQ